VPLLRGRDFGPQHTADSPPVAIVNRELVRQMFGDADPLGIRIRSHRDEKRLPRDRRSRRRRALLRRRRRAAAAGLRAALPGRLGGDDGGAAHRGRPRRGAARGAAGVAAVDSELPLDEVQTMDAAFASSVAPRRFVAGLIGGFAAMAVLLALVGVYGVLAYEVGQRRSEIGVRMALGSRRGAVVGLVVREAAALVVAGVAARAARRTAARRSARAAPLRDAGEGPGDVRLGAARARRGGAARGLGAGPRAARVEPIVALRVE
jgi:hypothetical protein